MSGGARCLVLGFVAAATLAACSSGGNETATSTSAEPESNVATVPAGQGELRNTEGFMPLNRATGLGFLRVMTLEERPNPRDSAARA